VVSATIVGFLSFFFVLFYHLGNRKVLQNKFTKRKTGDKR